MFDRLKNCLRAVLGTQKPAPAPATKSRNNPKRKQSAPKSKPAGDRPVPRPEAEQRPRSGKSRTTRRERRNDSLKSGAMQPQSPRRKEPPIIATKPKTPHPEALIDVPPCEGKSRFRDFPLHEEVLFGVQTAGFQYCTPIQALTLPPLLEGRDLAGKAQTGTGKTAAFLLAVFTKLLNHPAAADRPNGTPRVLILAPTRELAIQIHKDAEQLGAYTKLNNVVVFGGMDHERQRRSLSAPVDLLIGTPGRVIDYSRGSDLDLSKVEILVIDEADRMLDMGFIPDIKRIVAKLPKRGVRQTLFFSATLDESILRISSGWLADPVVIESEPEHLVSENIEQTFYSVSRDEKLALLLYILKNEPYDRVLIFGNRKDVNLRLQYDLARYGYTVPVLSGDIAQDKRIKILERFRSGDEKVVIATDVAARGIHVDDVSLVINYDLPERSEDYIHRIGRTGRAGHKGKSISFLCEYGAYYLPAIEELLHCQFPSALPTEEMLKLPEATCEVRLPKPPRNSDRRRAPGYGGGRGRSGRLRRR